MPSRCFKSVTASSSNRVNWVTPEERVAFVRILLDRGARMDVRDELLQSTPLGWACRWGRLEVAKLLLERGADPVERDAELWTTPHAWAEKGGHKGIRPLLREYERRRGSLVRFV